VKPEDVAVKGDTAVDVDDAEEAADWSDDLRRSRHHGYSPFMASRVRSTG
jgi:hypothetical protein